MRQPETSSPIHRRSMLKWIASAGAASAAGTVPSAWVWAAAPQTSMSGTALAAHLLNRAALGPRPGDLQTVAATGYERWVDQQLQPQTLALPAPLADALAEMVTPQESHAQLLRRFRDGITAERRAPDTPQGKAQAEEERRALIGPTVTDAISGRIWRALASPRQLEEVLVDFWFNHFNVFVGKNFTRVLVGAYEREAIRPHVLGRFRDLLGATAKHPAMLVYLDQTQSVAPGFRDNAGPNFAGMPPPSGLNENYARELMELHTLGVDGGYTQADVTALARMLTGWTINRRAAQAMEPGHLFTFDARRHDTTEKLWLGQRVSGPGQVQGVAEGEWALDVLAAHPATARHIAYKLAQAFVADDPPTALVQGLAERFAATGGDLRAVTRALLLSPEMADAAYRQAKFKTPYHFVLSSLRSVGAMPRPAGPVAAALNQQGMPLYGAQTPDGYKNTAAAWVSAEAITQRIQFATQLAQGRPVLVADRPDAAQVLATLGPAIGDTTRSHVMAERAAMQATVLWASPDFMRR